MHRRGDKKTQFSPSVPIWLKEIVVDVGKHMNRPMGDAAKELLMEAQRHTGVITRLAPFFWRTLERGDHIWPGRENREDISSLIEFPYDRCERLKFRLTQDERRTVDDIIFAMAVPDAHVMAALLVLAIHDKEIVRAVAPTFTPTSRFSIERRDAKWHGYSVR